MEYQPSKYRITSVSIDSRFADQTYTNTSEFMIRLPANMRNVIQISLSSVELPQVAYVFAVAAGNTAFSVEVGGVRTRYDISEGNYTPAELAAAVDAVLPLGFDVSFNSITDRITVSSTVPATLYLYDVTQPAIYERPRDWGLGFNMGFRKVGAVPGAVVVSGPVVAVSPPLTASPSYMLLQLQCPDLLDNTVHRIADGSYVNALAKLVLRSGSYKIQYDDGGNLLRKETMFAKPTTLTQLRIRLLDAYGNIVNMADTDWSMTFQVTEVVSSCQYAELNRAYGRC